MSEQPRGYGNYDLRPRRRIHGEAWSGNTVWQELGKRAGGLGCTVIDTCPGVDTTAVIRALEDQGLTVIDVADAAALSPAELDSLLARNLTDDRVFGVLAHIPLESFYRLDALQQLADGVAGAEGPVVLVGWGASLVPVTADLLVLADLPRWEVQQRQRAGAPNWRSLNEDEDPLRKYKRSFFVEWRTADLHKSTLWPQVDLVLDTTRADTPTLTTGDMVRDGMFKLAREPFRLVPYFDPGVWGGEWMREVCGLPSEAPNYAWCFDCVPEENSILFEVTGSGAHGVEVELPASNLVQQHPVALLGALTHARFGPEFPIRFDLLDTMGGGNLSLQVHPLTGYIQRTFGMPYTQDESYYLLDADPEAQVYLGLREDVDPSTMMDRLRAAQRGEGEFDTLAHVNSFPAARHDHFSIPAGTVHCSGANSMVLEISATPFIFTFKLWDWGRLGLDGLPRPINIDHAEPNIQWDRRTEWVREHLVKSPELISEADGVREERTGLAALEFIETRRHWIKSVAQRHTRGTVHVVNLVEGAEAILESPTGEFEPFVVHYAETFVVPASVGAYTVRPHGPAEGDTIATITAEVRGTTC